MKFVLENDLQNLTEAYIEENYSDLWYYNVLSEKEQKIYVNISEAIKNEMDKATYVSKYQLDIDSIKKVYEAITLDNPEYIYLENNYYVNQVEILGVNICSIFLKYTNEKFSDNVSLDPTIAIQKMDIKAQEIINEIITYTMTDYEKELAVHDYLINNVKYYEFENVDNIPRVYHTSYGAIVKGEAVCDGIAYAFKYIMDKIGIETIVVNGELENIGHSWNKVKIGSAWYNLDVTSDANYNGKVACHAYFNVTDEEIIKTHTLDNVLILPSATSDEYGYYKKSGFIIDKNTNLEPKLRYIITNTSGDVLEFKIKNNGYTIDEIVHALYGLNFNNKRNNKDNKFNYYQINDIYMFQKI